MVKKLKAYKSHIVSGSGGRMRINGLPVVDAKKSLILEVTGDDIRHSSPLDNHGCAAYVAAMRQVGVADAYVHLTKIYIKYKSNKYYERYENPRRLRDEIVVFDRKGEMVPDEFTLRPPYESTMVGGRKAYNQSQKKYYRLRAPSGNNALPKKSTWKTYKGKGHATGTRPHKHIMAKVRARPSGYTK